MFKRALIIALWGAYAAAIAPLAIPADDDCALYLTGPGRSSAYDYSLNLLKGNFGYEGQHTCITYDAINQAYLDARNRILVSQPKDHWKAEDFASVGELVLDISIQLARTYGLTYEEIEKGLPLIDTSRTLIREVCPPVFSHVECRAGKYRRLDGLCNNLQHPTWGATMAPFQRLIGPLFSDGINAPRISHSGHDLPLSRVVSRTMHPDDGFHDHAGTVMVIAWGQFMDHDFTLTGTPLDPVHRNDPEECCKRPPHLKHPYCNEIRIPEDDYFYRLFGVKCMDFVRGFPSPRPGCRLGSRNPFNTLTGSIDGNTVYGVTDKFSRKLRTGYGGLLRMNPVFKEYGLKDLLPLKLDIPDEGCTRPNKNMYCFEAGEIRVNEQLVLTVMHTLMAREHNRVAEALAAVNPHWDDEMLFQEARRINIAEIQHITYNEFLPILLGKDVMEKFGLVLEKQGYWNGYDPEVNPDVLASFAAAAYRFGHSLLPTAVERWSKAHKFIASKRLSDLIRRPYDLYRAGVLDEYVMGLMNQVAQAMDDSITQEVTNHLFKKVGARFGMDLVSLNMQRGREFGLPGYMEFRKFCGLSGAESFGDLYGSMPNETVRKYETIFEHPIDVDLWSGGVSERPLPGSMLGPTFACIIATQFSYSRRGDRFWFELPNQPSSFTPEQMAEIRKSRLARIICDNTDIIDTVQLYPMVLPDHELNPRVPCRSGIIPQMDFSKWADPLPFHGAAKQFVTDAIVLLNEKQNNTIVKTLKNTKQDENKKKNDVVNINCSNLVLPIKEQDSEKYENNTDCFGNSTENVIDDNMKKNGEEPCIQKLDDTKQITNNLLKYIYKKNDKVTNNQKSNGHFKNKLKRKKRSPLDTPNTVSKNNVLPVMIDYVTSHQTKDKNNLFLPVTVTGKTVQSSNLADFNIETIHSSVIKPTDVENKKNTEIKYHGPTTNNVSFPSESIETNTREFSSDKDHERLKNQEDKDISSSLEEYRGEITSKSAEYDKESTEKDNSKILNPVESEEYSSVESHSFTKSPLKNSNENSKSEDDESIEHKYQSTSNINKKPLHLSSHEVLDDVNSKSDEEDNFQKKTHDKYSENKTMNSSANSRTDHNESNESNSAENKESYEDSHSQEDINKSQKEKQTHINDAEVKPVVELNNESSESSEENLQEPNNIQSNKRDKLVTYSTDDVIKTDKDIISASNEDIEKIDVKQQFERIPLDYNHADKRKDNQNSVNETKIPITEQKGSDEDKEGTLDTLLPTYPSYDDKLNTKFHDLTIKLPEIKLPDDILSFAYEGPHYETKKDKNANKRKLYYNYNEDDSHERDEQVKSEDDFDKFYKRSNGFTNDDNNENQKSREDNNEDLYEKFVRERFGKKSFKERSEKLQALEINSPKSKLHKTFKDILKKTKDVQKEAERSEDPNSNYMWTLEYGETL